MMAQPISLTVFLIKVLALIKSNVLVRSVCLQDVLTFYYDENDTACKFNKDDFDRIFIDNTGKCQLFDCSIDFVDPPYSDMETYTIYELERLEIIFFETDEFRLEKPCPNYHKDDVYVTIRCGGKYLQDRGIGESCLKDNQCARVTVNSTCNETARICQCKEGHLYLWETGTCSPEQDLGGQCSDTRQCKRVTPYSMCSVQNKCECINGYTKLNNTCLPERRLNETCDDDIQCSVITPNSTCNKTTKVCECTEGHLEMLNICVYGRVLMEGISNYCKRSPLVIDNLADKNFEEICSIYSEVSTGTFEEAEKNSGSGLVIGVGITGFVIGIAICGAVFFIVTRHRTKSPNRTNTVKEDTKQQRSVEVSKAVDSKQIPYKDKKCNISVAVENDVYNHLHEEPVEVCIQPEYDHVPQLGTEDDDYSHLATCNPTDVDSPGEYGVVN